MMQGAVGPHYQASRAATGQAEASRDFCPMPSGRSKSAWPSPCQPLRLMPPEMIVYGFSWGYRPFLGGRDCDQQRPAGFAPLGRHAAGTARTRPSFSKTPRAGRHLCFLCDQQTEWQAPDNTGLKVKQTTETQTSGNRKEQNGQNNISRAQ